MRPKRFLVTQAMKDEVEIFVSQKKMQLQP